jgi:hypothetical protein
MLAALITAAILITHTATHRRVRFNLPPDGSRGMISQHGGGDTL